MSPAVSVILTTYNYGRFLAGALDSVLGQTFGDFEVIVVDDGSTDDTAAEIGPYLGRPRVHYERTNHVGASRARNIGICLARASLIAFLDADDLWLPQKLERQIAVFRADPELGVVYTRRLLIDPEGWQLEHAQPPHYRGQVLPHIFRRNFLCFSSSLVRRSVFDSVGLFDEGLPLAMDYDLWLRVALRYRFDYVDEPLVKYRTGHANLSRRSLERARVVGSIMRRFLDAHGGRKALSRGVIRLTLAEHSCDVGSAMQGPWRAAWYVRALAYSPLHPLAWHALLAFWWPDWLRVLVRRVCGRPDWQRRQRIAPVGQASEPA
jgi:glycosyltransferase involved in cell wall biosynthesis